MYAYVFPKKRRVRTKPIEVYRVSIDDGYVGGLLAKVSQGQGCYFMSMMERKRYFGCIVTVLSCTKN